MPDLHSIEHLPNVWNENLGLGTVGVDRPEAKVHEGGSVGLNKKNTNGEWTR
jgi:hypothetical protein